MLHLTVLLLALFTTAARAEVRLPRVFGPEMVIQRDKPAAVWGWAGEGEKVTVRFKGQTKTATAGADGKWKLTLDPMPASAEGRELLVTGDKSKNPVILRNVVVGDVWICSGDFGVYWEMFAVMDAAKEIAAAELPQIRLLKVVGKSSNQPLDNIEQGAWRTCSPPAATGFSALAFFFGRELSKELNVPIGLVDASYRYSSERAWMSTESFRMVPELSKPRDIIDSRDPKTETGKAAFNASIAQVEAWLPQAEKAFAEGTSVPRQPRLPAPLPANDANYLSLGELSLVYNGTIAPLTPMTIRGVVFSIGESGALEAAKYRFYIKGLADGWRAAWNREGAGQGEFPFYLEVIAAVNKPESATPGVIDHWTLMRQEQIAAAAMIPNSAAAMTYDVSDYVADSRNRQDAAHRLALIALAKEYGKKVEYSGPAFKSLRIDGAKAVVSFDHLGGGLIVGEKDGLAPLREVKDGKLVGFAIAGEDKKWHWAEAKIDGDTVVVTSDKVAAPAAVRYATQSNPSKCNLYNRAGLPAVPFATDEK